MDKVPLAAVRALMGAAAVLSVACGPAPEKSASRRLTGPFEAFIQRPDASLIAYAPSSNESEYAGIERALSTLRPKFNGLVLYGFDQQTPVIFELATKLGYQAILASIWDPRSDTEIREAVQLLRQYSDRLALAVSVGSEGLLDQRYSLMDLESAAASLDRQLGPAHRVEKTTSEPWWRYLDGQPSAIQLRAFGDFVAIHAHVVWDADIVEPAAAARWSRNRALQIRDLSGRTVLVRETGLPGGGHASRPSLQGMAFSREAQAAFWREWVALRRQALPGTGPFVSMCVAFEATDNVRKTWRDFESTWGLLGSHDLRPHPAWEAFPDIAPAGPAAGEQ